MKYDSGICEALWFLIVDFNGWSLGFDETGRSFGDCTRCCGSFSSSGSIKLWSVFFRSAKYFVLTGCSDNADGRDGGSIGACSEDVCKGWNSALLFWQIDSIFSSSFL